MPVLNCDTTMVKVNEGEDLNISCILVLGYGQAEVANRIWWKKLNKSQVII